MQAPIDGLLFYSERLPWGTSVGTAVREDLYLTPFTDADNWTLNHGDCLDALAELPDSSVNLIATDPPYFRIKNLPWDRQWDKPAEYLAWLDRVAAEWQRVLAPNGSLYCFASPRMAARVECLLGERFCVLNRIRWMKEAGWHNKTKKDALRSFLSPWEECIFAEHPGADNMAKGEAGYATKCDELRGFIFEPLRAYLDGEKERAGFTTRRVAEAFQQRTGGRTVTGMAGHWFLLVQWTLPTADNYAWLRDLFNRNGGEYLRREWANLQAEYERLWAEYEDLRREYEDLRRPFAVTADVPYTDVWDFPTVRPYPGKHPCEKPLEMMEHIVRASSREGDTVLDCFMGSGVTGEAAIRNGRKFVGVEMAEEWCKAAEERIMWTPPIGESVV